MSSRQHTALLLLAIFLAFIWLQIPALKPFSLQAVALATVSFFLIKRYQRSKLHHVLPKQNSVEMALVTFSLLLLIGNSGTLNSPLFPLTYIHLFFLVMSSSRSTAITVGPATALFHFGLEPVISLNNIGHLVTIPIILVFFLFAREQHESAVLEKQTIIQEEMLLTQCSEKTSHLQQEVATLKQVAVDQNSQLDLVQKILSRTQKQLFHLGQRYFVCEPNALAEIEAINQEINQVQNVKSPTITENSNETA